MLCSKIKISTFLRPFSTASLELPPCDFKPQAYDGPTYKEVQRIRKDHLFPGVLTYYKKPVLLYQGHMQYVWDTAGKRYLDFIGGIVTTSVGHCHPKVVSSAKSQLDKLWHTTSIYYTHPVHEYAQKLASKMPDHLKVFYFVNSGSEANDLAIMLSRLYTKRFDVLSFRNAYHGMSPYMMGLTSLSSWRHELPVGFGVHNVMVPDVYRGEWGGGNCRDSPCQTDRKCDCKANQCQACDRYINQLQDVLRFSTPKSGVAAFIAEPIQGVGGSVQYPKGYLKRASDIVQNNGGLFIADEVQTGFGRTGTHFWGFEAEGVKPDIVTMAKGIANGMPMAALCTTPEIAQVLSKSLHFNTYGGDPFSCAVASTVLDVLEEDKCMEVSHSVGTYLLKSMDTLRDEFALVGDVRGKGLMCGLELVADKSSRRPLDADKVNSIFESLKDHGLLVGKGGLYGSVLRIKPPMCITKQDADFAVAVLRKVLSEHSV